MLTRKRIVLLNGDADLAPIISREQLKEHQQAQNILAQAERKAQMILDDADQQRQAQWMASRQQAELAFWQQADPVLAAWQQQYQRLEAQVVEVMDAVLVQALEQLVGEVPEPARLTALLRQLLRVKSADELGDLYCHPLQHEQIATWLEQRPHLAWQLYVDEALPTTCLKLLTAHGELHLDWQQAVQRLNPPACHDLKPNNE